ncbi:hypothetical protein FHR32_006061 [Streptosporangium album]|uniref:Uncharacterized protein n=1 Tax=Streptosporangium album TaxID=47479 RepID=A0A7W7WCW0_9ACTN|nr:hypothetical protein [Streptosporangium album]MBB4941684.1 hypothetical protein [Streptosporangium album]
MSTPDELERQFTLLTAAARYDALRARDALASPADEDDSALTPPDPGAEPLTRGEALELLALGEVIARKAGYGRQLSVRSARQAGASWSQIGAALGTSKQAAWEAHSRWIDEQAKEHQHNGHWGWDENDVAAARTLAGAPEGEGAG